MYRCTTILMFMASSIYAQPGCTCDVNNDGAVDLGDLGLIESMFINSQVSSCHAGPVSLDDVGRVVNGFLGNGCVPLNAVRFSQCQALTTGSWYLDTPITAAVSSKCIDIENTSNVTLQCAPGATISAAAGSTPFPPLFVSNSANVKVQSCTMRSTGTTPTLPLAPVYVLNGSTVTLQDSGAVGGQSYAAGGIVTVNGGSYETWVADSGTLNINGGTFTAVPNRGYRGSVIWADEGQLNIDGGVFDGGWSGATNTNQAQALQDGVDDTILLYFARPGGSIKNATFRNAWDTHIENVGLVQGWEISGNKFYRWGISSIGGWYRSQWDSNRVLNNIAYASANAQGNAPRLFSFSYGPWSGISDPVVYFRGNLFSGNQWIPDASVSPYVSPAPFNLTETALWGAQLVTSPANVFTGNDFRNSQNLPGFIANLPIYGEMRPAGVMADGGGNLGNLIAWPNQSDHPIVFH